jgi:hypothetical protein
MEYDPRLQKDPPIVKVEVEVEKNEMCFPGDWQNFTVQMPNYDLGDPVGNGALEDFESSYQLKYDEYCKCIVVKQNY